MQGYVQMVDVRKESLERTKISFDPRYSIKFLPPEKLVKNCPRVKFFEPILKLAYSQTRSPQTRSASQTCTSSTRTFFLALRIWVPKMPVHRFKRILSPFIIIFFDSFEIFSDW